MTYPDTPQQRVDSRDLSKLKIPNSAYAFKFFDVLCSVVTHNGKRVTLKSARFNESPVHYYGGKVYPLDEIERDFPEVRTFVGNARRNGDTHAILNRFGYWDYFEEGDTHIEAA